MAQRAIRNSNYTFVNGGTTFSFNPDTRINLPEGPTISILKYHMDLARFLDSPRVYILDPLGAELNLEV